MKICVLSDSHGSKKRIKELLDKNSFDIVFYLGDGLSDVQDYTEPNFKKVCGNCDWESDEPTTRYEVVLGHKIMLTHGHVFRAKLSTLSLSEHAKQNNYQVVCYGHTHKQKNEYENGVLVVNPGAFKNGNYAVLNIEKDKIEVALF